MASGRVPKTERTVITATSPQPVREPSRRPVDARQIRLIAKAQRPGSTGCRRQFFRASPTAPGRQVAILDKRCDR